MKKKSNKCKHLRTTYYWELGIFKAHPVRKCLTCDTVIEYVTIWLDSHSPSLNKSIFRHIKENFPDNLSKFDEEENDN